MNMVAPVRFPSGVASGARGTALFNYPDADPTKVYTYFDDFNYFNTGDWTITTVEAGAGSATEALTDGSFGELLITNDAADNDEDEFQKKGESFLPVSGKKMWFKTRFKISDATQSDFLIGLAVTDTTLLGATNGDGVTDGIFFAKEDGDTNIDFHVQKDTTTGQLSTSAIGTIGTSYVTLGWEFDGLRFFKVYKDDVHVSTVDITTTFTAFMPDTELTISFAIMNGEAVAKTMTVDYIFAAIER
jgi:hypothetical protein